MPEEAVQQTIVNPLYWEKLAGLHPTDVCNRSEAIYHPSREGFVLAVYNQRYLVLPRSRKILRMEWNEQPVEEEIPFFLSLMILVYLIEVKDVKPSHTWVSGKDLKGGATFFRGPHSLDVRGLEERYGRNPATFLQAGRELGEAKCSSVTRGFRLTYSRRSPWPTYCGRATKNFLPG